MQKLLTTEELASLLQLHENTIRQYVKEGMPVIQSFPTAPFRFERDRAFAWLRRRSKRSKRKK